jgi:hypothetical protein
MRRHGNPSRRTLEKLLSAAGSSLAEFEALRIGVEAPRAGTAAAKVGDARRRGWTPAPPEPLPLLASSHEGEWQEPGSGIELMQIRADEHIERLPRPSSLAGDREAYAVTVVGDSMWPRFRPGRRIAVSPRCPVAICDDVLLYLEDSGEGGRELVLLKELVKRTGAYVELRQFNPNTVFRVPNAEVKAIHKVAGELF